MRKLIWSMGVSLDGFIEGPNREIDWHVIDEDLHQHHNDRVAKIGVLIHGRVLYELMAAFWPTADADPDAEPVISEFAAIWRNKPKLVFSKTLDHVDWNSTLLRDIDPVAINALKAEPGGDLGLGGSDLGNAFMRLGLVDEIDLYVNPVLIGRGKPLFIDERADLRLIETQQFRSGVVRLRYDVAPRSTSEPITR